MPLTPAERQRKYREKLKLENPEKYEENKKKVAENAKRYYRKKATEYTEVQKENRRQKWRDERKKQRQEEQDKERINQNNPIKKISKANKRFQMRVEYNLRKKNREFEKEIATLRKQLAALNMKYYRQSKKMSELNEQFLKTMKNIDESKKVRLEIDSEEQTPAKQTERFLNENLPNIDTPQKEKVKRKIMEYNVLTESLKKEYAESKGKEKKTLKKLVTNDIVSKYKLKTRLKSTLGLKSNIKRNRDRKVMKNKLLNEIGQFYDRDDNSRATAGKKEFKTKNKLKLQRRYLLDTIKRLHKKYKEEGGKASLSVFKKYRPFYVLKPKISDRDTCACVKHANMAFKAKTLKQLGVLESDNLSDVISKLVCNKTSKDCMYGLCKSCKDNVIDADEARVNLNEKCDWCEWKLQKHEYGEGENQKITKKMMKTKRQGSIQDLINAINGDLKQFLHHSYNISHQYQSYKACINNLEPNETVIHIDFSENYVCKLHTEVQAMHFGSSKVQITLHTGVFYTKSEPDQKPTSFCTMSPENKHSPEAIWAHLTPILQYIKTTYPQIDTVHFFSDGPTSQYRNKKNFYLLSQIRDYGFKHATWSFFEAAHGKGAADGVGGAIKRNLDSNVAHGADISDAKAAFEILSKSDTSIKIFYIRPEDIKPLTQEIVKNLHPLPNTLKIHQVIFNEKNSINYRYLSCFCRNMSGKCDCHAPQLHKFEMSKTKTTSRKNKQTQKKTNKVGKKKMRRNSCSSISSTDSDSIQVEYLDDSDATHFSEIDYLEELYSDENHENIPKETHESVVEDLERRELKDTTDENANCPNRTQGDNKTATRKVVTILSEVRGSLWNIKYSDLKQLDELQLKDIPLQFDLHTGKESSDCTRTKENIDPYKNPVASTSGTNKWSNLEKPGVIYHKHKVQLHNNNGTSNEKDLFPEYHKIEKIISASEKKTLIKTEKTKNIEDGIKNQETECIVEADKSSDEIENSIKNINNKDVTDVDKIEKIQTIVEVNQSENTGNIVTVNEKTEVILEVKENENTIEKKHSGCYHKSIAIGQSVLVRYYMRKKWKYYIGWVEEINTDEDDTNYTINFLKTVKKPTLKFVNPKKIDRDNVPSNSIVKSIELLSNEKKSEYLLKNDFDSTYFDV